MTRTIKVPESILAPCEAPKDREILTNKDLITIIIDWQRAFFMCKSTVDAAIIFNRGQEESHENQE